jgi:hypothetical protein
MSPSMATSGDDTQGGDDDPVPVGHCEGYGDAHIEVQCTDEENSVETAVVSLHL